MQHNKLASFYPRLFQTCVLLHYYFGRFFFIPPSRGTRTILYTVCFSSALLSFRPAFQTDRHGAQFGESGCNVVCVLSPHDSKTRTRFGSCSDLYTRRPWTISYKVSSVSLSRHSLNYSPSPATRRKTKHRLGRVWRTRSNTSTSSIQRVRIWSRRVPTLPTFCYYRKTAQTRIRCETALLFPRHDPETNCCVCSTSTNRNGK